MAKYISKAACYRVAKRAKDSLNDAYREYVKEGMTIAGNYCSSDPISRIMEDCELYLYVYSDESWTIDHAQYLTDHRNIVSAVSLAHYNSIKELAAEIDMQQNYC